MKQGSKHQLPYPELPADRQVAATQATAKWEPLTAN